MVHQYRPNFPHRFNADGTFDSICTLCHLTVASVQIEAELVRYEQRHKCNPIRLYQLTEYPLWPVEPSSNGPRPRSAGARIG
jgi:hypothetical protein